MCWRWLVETNKQFSALFRNVFDPTPALSLSLSRSQNNYSRGIPNYAADSHTESQGKGQAGSQRRRQRQASVAMLSHSCWLPASGRASSRVTLAAWMLLPSFSLISSRRGESGRRIERRRASGGVCVDGWEGFGFLAGAGRWSGLRSPVVSPHLEHGMTWHGGGAGENKRLGWGGCRGVSYRSSV